jgi:hypothetical protein
MNHGTAYRTPQQPAPPASIEIPHCRVPYVRHLVPDQTMRCARCGVTFHPAALHHDRALLLASCCPRCDGPLLPLLPDNGREAGETAGASLPDA